jgi:hypothetical protein
MMRARFYIFGTALCVAALGAPVVRAQQQSQDQGQEQTPDQTQQQASPNQGPTQPAGPIPAYRSPLASAADNDEDEDTDTGWTPDARSLTGVENLSLGMPTKHSYWQPHFDISSSIDSNPVEGPGQTSWSNWTSFSGGIDVHRPSGNSNMTLSYIGGGMISNDSGASNGVVQDLNFSERFLFRRWAISFFDQLNYLPESSFGFNGLGAGSLPGTGGPGLGPVFEPGQSLLTGRGQNLENSSDGEVDTFLTARSSLTFAGGYTLAHYFDSDLLNSGGVSVRAGYNYQMDRKDTIAVSYTFGEFIYSNFNQSIVDHTVQLSYGRRVTGRLAFQVGAGPQVAFFHASITPGLGSGGGEGGTGTSTPGSTTELYWSLSTSLQYQMERANLGLTYSHGVSGGSGVLAGSVADIVNGSVTRRVSRTFSSGITGGYSRNKGLAIGTVTPSSQTFDYWFVGANLSHPIGRSLGLSLSYQLQYQNSNASFCLGPTCGTSVIRHLISFGVGWHERPISF